LEVYLHSLRESPEFLQSPSSSEIVLIVDESLQDNPLGAGVDVDELGDIGCPLGEYEIPQCSPVHRTGTSPPPEVE
jgi:hypothetical protein